MNSTDYTDFDDEFKQTLKAKVNLSSFKLLQLVFISDFLCFGRVNFILSHDFDRDLNDFKGKNRYRMIVVPAFSFRVYTSGILA